MGSERSPFLFFHNTMEETVHMHIINPQSINDLVALKKSGVPVTLTSHPGNASLYKLSLWACGIPEHLWDVTCCKADANNWPMYRLCNGIAELLVEEELFQKILTTTSPKNRFVTAYQFTKHGERLGRFHVRAMQQLFPTTISSCSRLLLSQKERMHEMFAFLAETRDDVFTRFITPDGIMNPIGESGIRKQDFANSFMSLLGELDHLLLNDAPITTHGGACYDGVMVTLAGMLAHYWQTGETIRIDVSGPDMIHYATQKRYQSQLSEMLEHIRKWKPAFIPKRFITHMFPGTYARVGHVQRRENDSSHISKIVLNRKRTMIESESTLGKSEKRALWDVAKDDNLHWPIQIVPNMERYFSQHDLLHCDGIVVVNEFWKNIPIPNLLDTLRQANALLRIK